MTVSVSIVVVLLLIAALVLRWVLLGNKQQPRFYDSRTCQGRNWHHAFPSSSVQDIREFLLVFVEAFAFPEKEKLKLNPEDQIFQIYRAIYPSKWMPDNLEIETLARDIKARYGISLEGVWSDDITLGELFQLTQRARAEQA